MDFVTFKIVDKKIVKRTAMQEQVIYPLRACNYVTRVDGKSSERTVFALPKFTIPEDKKLGWRCMRNREDATRCLRWIMRTLCVLNPSTN